LHIPENVNANVRECKIGKVLAVGGGSRDSKGRHIASKIEPGWIVYYSRWGKQIFEGFDTTRYIVCRSPGVMACVDIKDGKPFHLRPLWDYLWLEEDKEPDVKEGKAGVVYFEEKDAGDYRVWNVLGRGSGLLNPNTGDSIPLTVNSGDKVYASAESGVNFSWNHEKVRREFRFMEEFECIAYEPASYV
jgi:co-chaperonin GroES (HSP10)